MTSTNKIDRAILFSQCEFFIDYYSSRNGCDRSLRLANVLEKNYSAKIVEQPQCSSTTHIIFKNGSLETKLFAKKYNIPLIDPMWLEHCIEKRRLIKLDKYEVINDENQQPPQELPFDRLAISNNDLPTPSTPKNKIDPLQNVNIDSEKKTKRILYTPVRGEFDQGNPHEYFDHQKRIITLDNLGMHLPDDNHMLIHRYGCSVARRQVQENPLFLSKLKDEPMNPIKYEELPTSLSIPSQSQSTPIVHFANTVRRAPTSDIQIAASPSTTFDFDSQKQYTALGTRPQSTPVSCPMLCPALSLNMLDSQKQYAALGNRPQSTPVSSPILRPALSLNILDNQSPKETIIEKVSKQNQFITPLQTADYSSFTKISPLNPTTSKIRFEICHNEDDDRELIIPHVQEIINDLQTSISNDRVIPRPPPLLVLSQAIRMKHPEQMIHTKLNNELPSVKDLPSAPANYSFVFYGFTSTQLEEAKRLTRRMGDCFSSETIDLTTTHVILPDDNPQISLTLDLLLALIYGCRLVTFEWLKSSSRIGEWLNVKKFEPKHFYETNPSLNIYRKSRQQQKPLCLFNECGLIYLTSLAKQRPLLLKLITLLGGNITVNRNVAKIVVGCSSKSLPIIIYPQVTEQWVVDSVKLGGCLPPDDYLLENCNE